MAAGREGTVRFPLCFAAAKELAVCLRDRPTRTLLAAGGSTGQCVFQAVQNALCAQPPEKVGVRFKPALKRTTSLIDLPERVCRSFNGVCGLATFMYGFVGPAKCDCDGPKHEFPSYCVS